MIIILASVVAAAGRIDEALALSQEHVERSRAEPGCLAHAVHRDTEDPHRLVFVEQWQDMAALQAHFAVPASREFAKALSTMTTQPPELSLFDASPVPMPGRPA
ncbi:putative quinol monooxygenase [Ideonella sp. DXS29W]|uniref:Quinol monooxygenase n=1 Tax=Ideonella lacteola TaxID=2984193 RepID=A0ABU9BKR3_9BURK